jgi:PAS domain S-box-containing protein
VRVMLFTNRSIDRHHDLERIIDYSPLVVAPETTAMAAISLMAGNKSDCATRSHLDIAANPKGDRDFYNYVLVVAAARPIGILTRRDTIELVAAGRDLAVVRVVEVMSAPVITLERSAMTDISTVWSALRQHDIRQIPIVDEGGLLVGMVTADDLLESSDLVNLSASPPVATASTNEIDRSDATVFQSQQDLSDFVENAIVCLHWVAADGTIVWANQAELDLLGYERDEYIGHSIVEFHADRATIDDLLDRLLHDRPVREYEADLICKDGSIRHVLIDSNSSWRNGEFLRTRCFTRDITERNRAETDLKQFNAALSHAMEGIALLDAQGHYVWVNQAYAEAIGYPPSEMVGLDWQRTVHHEDLHAVELAYGQMLDRGKVEVAARGVRKDGSTFYKQLVMVAAGDGQQQVGYYCFMKDITDRQRKEDILRNIALGVSAKTGAAFFEALVEYLTKALRVEYASICELVKPDRYRLQTIAVYGNGQLLPSIDYAMTGTPCEQTIQQHVYICPDRLQQYFPHDPFLQQIDVQSYMGLVLQDSTGQALGLLSIMSCQPFSETQLMTEILNIFAARAAAELERQRSQLDLQQQKQDLARSNDELQQFAYVASHDLQEPLRMITSYLELLERRYKGQLDAKADTFIAYAVDGASRMQTLINDLLNYSRVGRQVREFEDVDCDLVLDRVLRYLQVTIAQNQAEIVYTPLPQVHGDPSQLIQLFQNIIGNAIKFRSLEPPRIEISAEYADDKWLFSVRDNGIGIENEYLDRIFVIFQRLHGKTEYPGTGIGLAVCKKIIERHGGNLWVESQPDRGSTFFFTLSPSSR